MKLKNKMKVLIGTLTLTCSLATFVSATTINYGITHYNPATSSPYGHAYTKTAHDVDEVGAKAKVRNSDGTETTSAWAYNTNDDSVQSADVTANTWSSSGVKLYGYHYVSESGYNDWNGTSSYSY